MNTTERLDAIDKRLEIINHELGRLCGSQRTAVMLIKFVVLPLIIILGGLVGIKIW